MKNLSLENAISILLEVQSDPILFQNALKECSDLYSEMFVANDSHFTGNDIINSIVAEHCDNYNDYLVELFCSNKRFEFCLLSNNGVIDASLKQYCSILKEEEKYYKREQLIGRYEYFEQDDDCDGGNEELLEDISSEIESFGEIAEPVDYFNQEEFDLIKDKLFEQFKTTQYVTLVNYKGEGEGEVLLLNSIHLRTFYGKYNYD